MLQPFGKSSRPKFNLQATLGYLFPQTRIAPLHFINPPYQISVLLRSAFGIALCYELIDVGFPCVNPTDRKSVV